MDRVFFELKRAHIETVKFGRRVLAAFGLTPARFDVLYAIAESRMTQAAVRRLLGVARATISEMLGVLEKLGFITRARAEEDRRTWVVWLTTKGRAVLERAADVTMHNGWVPLLVDAALCARDLERYDSDEERESLGGAIFRVLDELGLAQPPPLYRPDLDLIEGSLIACWDPLGQFEPEGSGQR
jgi:DNA-binding MarR family transcriptional regulator